jgi:hypothetical protein
MGNITALFAEAVVLFPFPLWLIVAYLPLFSTSILLKDGDGQKEAPRNTSMNLLVQGFCMTPVMWW